MNDRVIKIGTAQVGRRFRPFLIAEMSGNHNQSLDRALAIVDAAAKRRGRAEDTDLYPGHHDARPG